MSCTCLRCKGESRVIDTRPHPPTVRRRRQCMTCNYRWTTFEVTRLQYDGVPAPRVKPPKNRIKGHAVTSLTELP